MGGKNTKPKQNPTKQTLKKKKPICQARFSCSFPLVRVHLFSLWWWILFLSLSKSGMQWASGTFTLANPDEVCCFCLYDITPTWRLQLLWEKSDFGVFFGIDWDLKPEINIHTLHRTEHLVAIYFKDRVSFFFLPEWGEVKGSVCEVLVMKTENWKLYQFWLMLLREKVKSRCWGRKHLRYSNEGYFLSSHF